MMTSIVDVIPLAPLTAPVIAEKLSGSTDSQNKEIIAHIVTLVPELFDAIGNKRSFAPSASVLLQGLSKKSDFDVSPCILKAFVFSTSAPAQT